MPDELPMPAVRGSQALQRLIRDASIHRVLDIGSGSGEHAAIMRAAGKDAFTIDLKGPADYVGDFRWWHSGYGEFDALWISHVLEHQPNPNTFLIDARRRLKPGGRIFVTVPPLKHEVVGGHVSLWNAGLLIYHLILAGFDCRKASVGTYASGPGYPVYNISAIATAPENPLPLPKLRMDAGDIEALAPFFPVPVKQGFDGRLKNINW